MKYISGWQALNLGHDDGAADWHAHMYFKNQAPTILYESEKSPLGEAGIFEFEFSYAFLTGRWMVASHARALADLVLLGDVFETRGLPGWEFCERKKVELFELLSPFMDDEKVRKYLKHEVPKQYFNKTPNREEAINSENKPDHKLPDLTGMNEEEIREFIRYKTMAFGGRYKIRDYYDVGYLLEHHGEKFSKEQLQSVCQKLSYEDLEEMDLLLKHEMQEHKLIAEQDLKDFGEKCFLRADDLLAKTLIRENLQLEKAAKKAAALSDKGGDD